MRQGRWLIVVAAIITWIVGCGTIAATNGTGTTTGTSATTAPGTGGATASTTSSSSSSGTGGAGGTPTTSTGGAGGTPPMYDAGTIAMASCSADPPPGAAVPPPPKAYTGGTCPTLVAGNNMFQSMGNARAFMLAVPADLQPNEKLPVIFLWHWLKGSPNDFYTKGDVQNAVDQQRFLAVLPQSKGDLTFNWPFDVIDSQSRMDEEFTFFDDMLSCVSQQFNVNASCVSSAGVSAGALFTDQLAGGRGDYLSSILSLSGGVGGVIKPWGHPKHHLPAIVLWGGPMDICIVLDFETGSKQLEMDLTTDGNFVVECIHNCGHGQPPFSPPPGYSLYSGLWQFALDHPYWLPPGDSPWTTKGLPVSVPTWCAIGVGKATPRTGPCDPPGC